MSELLVVTIVTSVSFGAFLLQFGDLISVVPPDTFLLLSLIK